MTDRAALIALRDAVEAGETPAVEKIMAAIDIRKFDFPLVHYFLWALDPDDLRAIGAAIALLEAVLPGYRWSAGFIGNGRKLFWVISPNWDEGEAVQNESDARALLIAILNAMIAKEQE